MLRYLQSAGPLSYVDPFQPGEFRPYPESNGRGDSIDAKSVDFADRDWRARYFAAKAPAILHVAPSELGLLQKGEDAYERNNRWMLDSALRFGAGTVDFVSLWNGEGGDGPGGTRHMMDAIRNLGGRTRWLDTTKLWG